MFCSGANIFMLGVSSHAWKVNFCKFTNETRNGLEDSSQHSGLKFLAAVNGACAGGGYELALACDEIILVDDRSSAVSLPEVPLLGVLPGTGGLTRVTDKRRVRHDLADIFCTTAEGVRGQTAKDWRLVDDIAKPAQFAAKVQERAHELAARSDRPADAQGRGAHAAAAHERSRRAALFACHAWRSTAHAARPRSRSRARRARSRRTSPASRQPAPPGIPLAMARELEDAILSMRTNELEIGTWLVKTEGDGAAVLEMDADAARASGPLAGARDHRPAAPHLQPARRFLAQPLRARSSRARASRARFLELALACDRSYQLALPDDEARAPKIAVGEANFGLYPMVTGQSRLQRRFYGEQAPLDAVRAKAGQPLDADAAFALGLVTSNPDDIDWADETRIAIEERVAMSPDALTGMEANLRFNGPENMFTRVFGRLTAWQNWIFQRPNAVGEKGALKVYGKGDKAAFDWHRV